MDLDYTKKLRIGGIPNRVTCTVTMDDEAEDLFDAIIQYCEAKHEHDWARKKLIKLLELKDE